MVINRLHFLGTQDIEVKLMSKIIESDSSDKLLT